MRFIFVLLVTGLAIGLLIGCRQPAATPSPKQADEAAAILQKMVAAYQAAEAYSDQGVVRLSYQVAARTLTDEAPLAVSLVRPDRLRVEAYQLLMVADDGKLQARVNDPPTNDLDRQVVMRAVSSPLALDVIRQDPLLDQFLRGGRAGAPLQLELLLGANPISHLLDPAVTKRMHPAATIDGQSVHRVGVLTDEGEFIFGVDQNSSILRRVELPTSRLIAQMQNDGRPATRVSLVADFVGADFAVQPDEATFSWQAPPDAPVVEQFVQRPQALPTELYGQNPGEFSFTGLKGQALRSHSLTDRIAVLLWFNNHVYCQDSLQQLSRAYNDHLQRNNIACYAVCTEPSSFSSGQIETLLQHWNVQLPVVRDLDSFGQKLFKIEHAPTLVVMVRGVVQIFEVGANPDLAEQLPLIVRRLEDGANIAGEILAQVRDEQFHYARKLYGDATPQPQEVVQPPLSAVQAPQQLKLAQLWHNQEIAAAGNLLVVDQGDDRPTIFVNDGFNRVVQLDVRGMIQARHELDLPTDARVGFLKTATDASGHRYFVGSAIIGKQAFAFDDTWQTIGSYPAVGAVPDGLHDIDISDVNGDGTLEMICGFWGNSGVHAATLAGRKLWEDRRLANVLSVHVATATTGSNGKTVLASGASGGLLQINAQGQSQPPVMIGSHGVHHLFVSDRRAAADQRAFAGPSSFFAVTYGTDGKLLGTSFDSSFRAQWEIELLNGRFDSQVRFVTSGRLRPEGDGDWIIIGPDGSIKIVGFDGVFTDQFSLGKTISGVAAMRVGGRDVLLLSAHDGVTALVAREIE